MSAATRQKKLRQSRLLAGLCVACGKNPPENNLIRCANCRQKHNNSSNSRKIRNKSNGLCACGKLATDGFKTCVNCRINAIKNHEEAVNICFLEKICKRCKQQSETTYCTKCSVILSNRRKRSREKLRDLAFSHYGGYECVCCGETEKLFLTIDHIDNNGAAHRKSINSGPGTSEHLYIWLRDNDYPSGFQVLCMNCNFGKYRNGGVCPHKNIV